MVNEGSGRGGEIALVDSLRRLAGRPTPDSLVLGIGDDCAIFRPPGAREDLLFTTDMLIEDVHFRCKTHQATDIGHKALARGLSDIAAMGGEPRFCLVSLALAAWADRRWIGGFYRGLLRLAARYRCTLAGGDLARASKLACDIVVCGTVPKGRALRRDGARVDDGIYISGKLGGSALGLQTGAGPAWKRHLRPQPRLELGRYLRDSLRATAAIDLSDGLSLDLRRLCLASGVAAEITDPPRFAGASRDHSLHGGEDYELLFTLPSGARPPVRFGSVPITRIGTVRKGRAGEVRLNGQKLAPLGYDHLRNS